MNRGTFQPDIFSSVKPVWHPLDAELERTLDEVQNFLPAALLPICNAPLQSATFGINSSNFKLATSGGSLLLKRWPRHSDVATISKTLSLMSWLSSNGIPVPVPLRFQNGELLLQEHSGIWCVFPFIDADYFQGSEGQLKAAAQMTGTLMDTLSRLPSSLTPENGPAHLTDSDGQILRRVGAARGEWKRIFGEESAFALAEHWDEVLANWDRLIANKPIVGARQAAHFDLHPHNLLLTGNTVTAVLDFEACKVIPVGYAFGFAALKQCRQAIAFSQSTNDIPSVGTRYLTYLVDCNPIAHSLVPAIGDMAICEILRRICIILRLNIENKDRTWNRVLPIQLGHLCEAKMLFD